MGFFSKSISTMELSFFDDLFNVSMIFKLSYKFNVKKVLNFLFPRFSPLFSTWKAKLTVSLVVQWLRIRLPVQGTRVRVLVWEDPTCHGAAKPMRHNYWAHVPQLLKPVCLEPVLHNKRSHHNEKPAHRNEE